MNEKHAVASAAALIADPARAAMLAALMDGRPLAAGELARAADVSAQSASMHLAQLLEGGLVQVAQEGRHRYYRLTSTEVAHAVEALGVISIPARVRKSGATDAISYARTCYDHLAGELAVALASAFEGRRLLVSAGSRDYDLTPKGEEFLAGWHVDVMALRRARRSFARRCFDWTERRDHLAGALGAALFSTFLERRWMRRERSGRVVHVTPEGQQQLASLLHSRHAAWHFMDG
jgi:DNA-binding transcriptional ArsR family regulator